MNTGNLGGIIDTVLTGLLIASGLIMVFFILLQEGKGGGLAALGGTKAAGVEGVTNPIRRATVYMAVLFFGLAVILGVLHKPKSSLGAGLGQSAPASSTAPEETPEGAPAATTTGTTPGTTELGTQKIEIKAPETKTEATPPADATKPAEKPAEAPKTEQVKPEAKTGETPKTEPAKTEPARKDEPAPKKDEAKKGE